ncbi:hypothetical protein FA132_25705 [Pseudomonas aeruginosa]|uniref:hypothetical protein n=2 Tax=Pseudomonas aeruginosa TaxID=287 RepID=UPI00104EC689|nr:hypothetical protein [Pseudomonas aeruginosa]MCO3748719.1 hypothetical protein [Pseudomonas aeruginosa]
MPRTLEIIVENHRVAAERRAAGRPVWDRKIDINSTCGNCSTVHVWDANKVSSLEIKCHPEQSGSGLVRPLEPPMIAACKAAIREEISKVTIEINDLRFQVRMTLYSHGSGVFRPFEGRCEALG